MQNMVEMSLTYGGLILGVALIVFTAWLERQPRRSLNPRLPTLPLMFLGFFICLLAIIHIFNAYGIHTGRR